jgi:hypothetical protein
VFRIFSTFFARLHLLSSDSFSSLIFFLLFSSLLWFSFFSSLLFSSLSLPASAFSAVHIVGSLTSKLPAIRRAFEIQVLATLQLGLKGI